MAVDLFTQEWREAEASCPPERVMLDTMEFRHSSLSPPFRIVSDLRAHSFRLEDDAPVHAGQMREFLACPVEAQLHVMSTEEMPRIDFSVDNVGREISTKLRAAVRVREAIIMRYRGYFVSDPEEVHYGPIELIMNEFVVTGSRLTASATVLQLQKASFPTITYAPPVFAAMIAQL